MKLLTHLPPTDDSEPRDLAVGYYVGQTGEVILTDITNQGSNTTAFLTAEESARVMAEIRACIDSI